MNCMTHKESFYVFELINLLHLRKKGCGTYRYWNLTFLTQAQNLNAYALSQISSGFYLINQNLQLTHANLLRLQIIPIVFSCENRYNEKFWGKEKWYFGFAIIFWKHYSVFISQLTVNWWLDAENIDYAFSTRFLHEIERILTTISLFEKKVFNVNFIHPRLSIFI